VTWPFVIGLGSHHGDDQAGWLVIDQLRERGFPSTRLARLCHPADLLDVIEGEAFFVICDACEGISLPGTIRRMRWWNGTPPVARSVSEGVHVVSEAEKIPRLRFGLPEDYADVNTVGNLAADAFVSGVSLDVGDAPSDSLRHMECACYVNHSGSHDLSLFEVMELGRQLGDFPESADIWTLEGASWSPGSGPSDAIELSAARVADAIWEGCHHA
jgi:Ni,Fe-hydrogenase maturation factor